MFDIDPLAIQERERLLAVIFNQPSAPDEADGGLLQASEVAEIFQVTDRTVRNWARRGIVPSIMTPGGRRRYPSAAVYQLAAETFGDLPPIEQWQLPNDPIE